MATVTIKLEYDESEGEWIPASVTVPEGPPLVAPDPTGSKMMRVNEAIEGVCYALSSWEDL